MARGAGWGLCIEHAAAGASHHGGDLPRKRVDLVGVQEPRKQYLELSDEFDGSTPGAQWSWVRQPDATTFGMANGAFWMQTQAADLYVDDNNASVLLEPTPKHDYVVETRVRLNLPAEGCCYNYVQAGLVIYGSDDNFIKLASVSIWETRQPSLRKNKSRYRTITPATATR